VGGRFGRSVGFGTIVPEGVASGTSSVRGWYPIFCVGLKNCRATSTLWERDVGTHGRRPALQLRAEAMLPHSIYP